MKQSVHFRRAIKSRVRWGSIQQSPGKVSSNSVLSLRHQYARRMGSQSVSQSVGSLHLLYSNLPRPRPVLTWPHVYSSCGVTAAGSPLRNAPGIQLQLITLCRPRLQFFFVGALYCLPALPVPHSHTVRMPHSLKKVHNLHSLFVTVCKCGWLYIITRLMKFFLKWETALR